MLIKRRTFAQSLLALAAASTSTQNLASQTVLPQDTDAANPLDWLGPGSLTDVPGIKVGHFTSKQRPTGCTVVLCEGGAVAGVDVRGAAPGTRETDLLNPINSVQQIQAIVLSGGSAYGLDAATGAMKFLEEHRYGYNVGPFGVVPIVPAAILFDLEIGDPKIRPNAESGYQACLAATSAPVEQGNVGAGAGASVGKIFGFQFAMKSGLGTASIKVGESGIVVGALVAVNSVGDIVNPKTGKLIAGARTADGRGLRNSMSELMHGITLPSQPIHTTIGVVATNVALDKPQMTKIAQMVHDGLARAINPIHTPADGDTIFALSTGALKVTANHGVLGAIAAEVMAQAVVRAVTHAQSLPGLPSYRELNPTTK